MGVLILERNEPESFARRAMKRLMWFCATGSLSVSLTAPPLSPLSLSPTLCSWAGKEIWEETG